MQSIITKAAVRIFIKSCNKAVHIQIVLPKPQKKQQNSNDHGKILTISVYKIANRQNPSSKKGVSCFLFWLAMMGFPLTSQKNIKA